MHFSASVSLMFLASSAIAAPAALNKRAAAGVLTQQTYANFQISDGVAGNALAEVNAKFPVRPAPSSLVPGILNSY